MIRCRKVLLQKHQMHRRRCFENTTGELEQSLTGYFTNIITNISIKQTFPLCTANNSSDKLGNCDAHANV